MAAPKTKKDNTINIGQGTGGTVVPTVNGVNASGANTLPTKTFGNNVPTGTAATSSPTTAGWDSQINRPVVTAGAEASKGYVAPRYAEPDYKTVVDPYKELAFNYQNALGMNLDPSKVMGQVGQDNDVSEEKKVMDWFANQNKTGSGGGGGRGGSVLPSVPAQLANQIADAYARTQGAGPDPYDNKYQAEIEAMRSQRYGDYESQYLPKIDNLVDRLLNRDSFSYNWSDDPLYRQYAARYQQQARQGMQDTMGQAAAMTGGYGSSYATAAANQAYANQMAGLNDQAMNLYQLAAENYDRDTNNMRSNLQQLEQREAANRSYYDTDRDVFYNRQDADLNNLYNQQAMDYQLWQDALARDQYEKDLAWQQYQYWNNLAHNKYRYY